MVAIDGWARCVVLYNIFDSPTPLGARELGGSYVILPIQII